MIVYVVRFQKYRLAKIQIRLPIIIFNFNVHHFCSSISTYHPMNLIPFLRSHLINEVGMQPDSWTQHVYNWPSFFFFFPVLTLISHCHSHQDHRSGSSFRIFLNPLKKIKKIKHKKENTLLYLVFFLCINFIRLKNIINAK